MKKLSFGLAAALGVMMYANAAVAAPTGAGVTISNQATAEYNVQSSPYTVSSPITTFRVAQIVNVSVTNMDVTTVAVGAGDTDKATTFRVTNLGNGPDNFVLTVDNAVAGNQFDPLLASIVIDTNGDGVNNAGDTIHANGSPLPLNAAQSVTVFVLNNIPSVLNNNDIGKTELEAKSSLFSAGGPVGTVLTGFGFAGVDAVLGVLNGVALDLGTYRANTVTVTLAKSSVITDIWGRTPGQPVPGATVTYTITATIAGTGTADALKIVDLIPANTTYKANTLTRNALPLTDALGDDAGDVTPTAVTFNLGNTTAGTQTVSFQVTIN